MVADRPVRIMANLASSFAKAISRILSVETKN
jgi:hypothetical protein